MFDRVAAKPWRERGGSGDGGDTSGAAAFHSLLPTVRGPRPGLHQVRSNLTWHVRLLASLGLGGLTAEALGVPAVYGAGAPAHRHADRDAAEYAREPCSGTKMSYWPGMITS